MLYSRQMVEEIDGYDSGSSPIWFDDLGPALSPRKLGQDVHRPELSDGEPSATPYLRTKLVEETDAFQFVPS